MISSNVSAALALPSEATCGTISTGSCIRCASNAAAFVSVGKVGYHLLSRLKGRVKEAAGALSGNKKLKREGKADQAVGKIKQKVEKAIGKVKETFC